MIRIDTFDNLFHDADKFHSGTVITAEWLNMVQEEIARAIEILSDKTADGSTNTQLASAIVSNLNKKAELHHSHTPDNIVENNNKQFVSKVDIDRWNDTVSLRYMGEWNAKINSPTIPRASILNNGWYYRVSADAEPEMFDGVELGPPTTIDGISDWKVGDWIISNGARWDKINNSTKGLVKTINNNRPDENGDVQISLQEEVTPLQRAENGEVRQVTGYAINGLPDPSTQAKINSLLAEGWPDWAILWRYLGESVTVFEGKFVTKSVTDRVSTSVAFLTGLRTGNFIPISITQPISISNASLLALQVGNFAIPSLTDTVMNNLTSLGGIQVGSFTTATSNVPFTETVSTLFGIQAGVGNFISVATNVQATVASPLLNGIRVGVFTSNNITITPNNISAAITGIQLGNFGGINTSLQPSTNSALLAGVMVGIINSSSSLVSVASNAASLAGASSGSLIVPSVSILPINTNTIITGIQTGNYTPQTSTVSAASSIAGLVGLQGGVGNFSGVNTTLALGVNSASLSGVMVGAINSNSSLVSVASNAPVLAGIRVGSLVIPSVSVAPTNTNATITAAISGNLTVPSVSTRPSNVGVNWIGIAQGLFNVSSVSTSPSIIVANTWTPHNGNINIVQTSIKPVVVTPTLQFGIPSAITTSFNSDLNDSNGSPWIATATQSATGPDAPTLASVTLNSISHSGSNSVAIYSERIEDWDLNPDDGWVYGTASIKHTYNCSTMKFWFRSSYHYSFGFREVWVDGVRVKTNADFGALGGLAETWYQMTVDMQPGNHQIEIKQIGDEISLTLFIDDIEVY